MISINKKKLLSDRIYIHTQFLPKSPFCACCWKCKDVVVGLFFFSLIIKNIYTKEYNFIQIRIYINYPFLQLDKRHLNV